MCSNEYEESNSIRVSENDYYHTYNEMDTNSEIACVHTLKNVMQYTKYLSKFRSILLLAEEKKQRSSGVVSRDRERERKLASVCMASYIISIHPFHLRTISIVNCARLTLLARHHQKRYIAGFLLYTISLISRYLSF